jgi:hypothetical protein
MVKYSYERLFKIFFEILDYKFNEPESFIEKMPMEKNILEKPRMKKR